MHKILNSKLTPAEILTILNNADSWQASAKDYATVFDAAVRIGMVQPEILRPWNDLERRLGVSLTLPNLGGVRSLIVEHATPENIYTAHAACELNRDIRQVFVVTNNCPTDGAAHFAAETAEFRPGDTEYSQAINIMQELFGVKPQEVEEPHLSFAYDGIVFSGRQSRAYWWNHDQVLLCIIGIDPPKDVPFHRLASSAEKYASVKKFLSPDDTLVAVCSRDILRYVDGFIACRVLDRDVLAIGAQSLDRIYLDNGELTLRDVPETILMMRVLRIELQRHFSQ